jgi:hypothetical protein
VWRWHRDSCLRHVKSGISSQISAVRQTRFDHPISLAPVNKTHKPPHINDKGRSGEEISQRDHGHNRKDLQPIRAWTWPFSMLPRARSHAQALPRAHPEHMSEPPSTELTCALKDHPRTHSTPLHAYRCWLDPVLSSGELCAARPSHLSVGHHGQPFLETPSLTRASRQCPRGAVKLLQARIEALPHWNNEITVDGLWPPATASRPSYQVNHSSMPCAYDFPDLPWSLSTHWPELSRRG